MSSFIFLKLKFNAINEIENFILLLNLGILIALKHNLIKIDLVEDIFYNPFVKKVLVKIGIKSEITDYLIHEGWELDALQVLDNEIYLKTLDEKIDYVINSLKKKD